MKQILLFSLIIVVVLSVTGCGNNPKTAARQFLTAMEQHNFVSAAKYVSKDSQETLEYIKERFDSMTTVERQDNAKKKYKITETEIEVSGESATVTYQESTITTNGSSAGGQPYTGVLKLITENSEWKVILEPGSGF